MLHKFRGLTLCLGLVLVRVISAQRPTVTLNDGIYVGTTSSVPSASILLNQFYGVPFAAKPERFMAPHPRPKGNEKHEAITQPLACPQQQSLRLGAVKENEDCLFLNLVAPQISSPASTRSGKAVMVFFHGGGLMMGGIGQSMTNKPQPDWSNLAANQDVIVISSQYRLGVFGFPGSVPGLPPDELNPGFRDQKMALRWVQENIHAFGGDPKKVTIFGQSGGAVSVDSHLVSEVENPPFRAAISQSGGLHTFVSNIVGGVGAVLTGSGTGNKVGEAPFITLAKALNCSAADGVACVKTKDLKDIQNAVSKQSLLFVPVDDGGKTMVTKPDNARRAKKAAKVPVLIGANFQEAIMFTWTSNLAKRSMEQWVAMMYPNNEKSQKEIVSAYAVAPAGPFKTMKDALLQMHSDYQFQCIAAYEAQMIASTGVATYRYIFNGTVPGLGPMHGSEGTFISGGTQSSPANTALSQKMQKAWADFAKDPAKGPGWAPLGSGEQDLADLGGEGAKDGITMIKKEVMDKRCPLFYDAYDPDRPKS